MSDLSNQFDNIDVSILSEITAARAEFDACTARHVAFRLNVSPDVVRHRLMKMSDAGVVRWNDMPGSLVVVADGAGVVEGGVVPLVEQEQTSAAPPAATTAKAKRPSGAEQRKRAAARKAAAAKAPAKKASASSTRRRPATN